MRTCRKLLSIDNKATYSPAVYSRWVRSLTSVQHRVSATGLGAEWQMQRSVRRTVSHVLRAKLLISWFEPPWVAAMHVTE